MFNRLITTECQLLRLMGIGTHHDRNMVVGHLFQKIVGGIVVGAAAFVDAAGVDFDNQMLLSDKFDAVVGQFRVPILLFGKEAFLVVHLDFIEMGDNIKLLSFNHFKTLLPKSSNGFSDITPKIFCQTIIIDFPFGAIDEPDMVTVGLANQVHAADDIVEVKGVFEIGERLGHAGDEVAFKTAEQLQIRILTLKGMDGSSILGDSFLVDAEIVLEGDGRVGGEAELVVVELGGALHKQFDRLLAVAEGGVGMVVIFHEKCAKNRVIFSSN